MCFSASTSFTASVLLAALGVVALRKTNKHTWMMSAIPVIFAVQQAAEGVVWIGIHNNLSSLVHVGSYTFLFFAFVVWPSWICRSLYYIENNPTRKYILSIAMYAGHALSAFLAIALIVAPVYTSTVDHHIAYAVGQSQYYTPAIVYLIVTVTPFFLSRYRIFWTPGVLLLISWGVTMLVWQDAFISLWCFYAALISAFIPVVKTQWQTSERNTE